MTILEIFLTLLKKNAQWTIENEGKTEAFRFPSFCMNTFEIYGLIIRNCSDIFKTKLYIQTMKHHGRFPDIQHNDGTVNALT